jgi:hypothetical protein
MHGAASQMNAAGADLDKEEDMQGLQVQWFYRKEITGQQLVVVLAEARRARYCSAGHAWVREAIC